MYDETLRKYSLAIERDPSVGSLQEGLKDHKGVPLEHMETLGLSKKELRRLIRLGLAVKGYTRNFFDPPETDEKAWIEVPITYKDAYQHPNGYVRYEKRVEMEKRPLYRKHGQGMRARYILIVRNPYETKEA